MANFTPNLNLEKPISTEAYEIQVFNGNADLIDTAMSNKVDKIVGKGLSTEDYSSAEKSKLASVAAGAEANVQPDWNAVSGDAAILNKPTIPPIYNLPAASAAVLGGVKVGNNLIIDGDGVLSATAGGEGGVDTFLELIDTPTAYSSHSGKFIKVKATEDGLEFANPTVYPIASAVSVADASNYYTGTNVENILDEIGSTLVNKAAIANPSFTGAPTAPTQVAFDNSTKLANTAMVHERAKLVQYGELYGSETLDTSYAGKLYLITTAATITVPPDSSVLFPAGTSIIFFRYGTGAVTFAQGSGVTILSVGSKKNIANQYEAATLYKTSVADNWLLIGALS